MLLQGEYCDTAEDLYNLITRYKNEKDSIIFIFRIIVNELWQ